MVKPARRVVTGNDENGKAVILMDGEVPIYTPPGNHAAVSSFLWVNNAAPVDLSQTEDPITGERALHPPPGGAVFRIVWFRPESEWIDAVDPEGEERLLDRIGAGHPGAAAARHPMMHRTDTIDYAVVISGHCTLILDDTETEVWPGDTIVQIANNHAWANRGTEPCAIAFILIDGKK